MNDPLATAVRFWDFFVKSGHVPKAQSMHKWVTFLPNSFCLSGDNAVLQFLRLFDPRDLGAINQDSPVIIVRISINFLTCLKNKLQKTNLIYALICYHLLSPILIQIETFMPCPSVGFSFNLLNSKFQGSVFSFKF